MQSKGGVGRLEFSERTHGWGFASDGRLLSTPDGGVTWKDISPDRKKTSTLAPSNSVPSGSSSGTLAQGSVLASSASAPTASNSTITTHKRRNLGFDPCAKPTTTPMGTRCNSGPYFDYGDNVGAVHPTC